MHWTTIYTPNSSGTVLSPDNYERSTTPPFELFQQTVWLNNTGDIAFWDATNTVIQIFCLRRSPNGEWYTPNAVLVKNPLKNKFIIAQVAKHSTACNEQQRHYVHVVQQQSNDTAKSKTWSSNLSTALKNAELCHQQFGHASLSTLAETQQVVNSMPPLPTAAIPFFKCPFCEKAKMTKYHSKSKPKTKLYIPGQAYHMNLYFVSGPSNLQDVLHKQAKPKSNLKKSCGSYIGFLTIINVAS